MTNKISPEFHAEIILEFFNEFRDFRKVRDRAGVLLGDASPEHLEAIVRHLPTTRNHPQAHRDQTFAAPAARKCPSRPRVYRRHRRLCLPK
jgi:hypothetical protein